MKFVKLLGLTAAISAGAIPVLGVAGRSALTEGVRKPASDARLVADLSDKILYLKLGDSVITMFDIADGQPKWPTPRGKFNIRKLTWNPSWRPPDSEWARKKTATGPGDPKNPMKVVKIFFKEPDYYIHGTSAVESLASAESHGCIRMAPDDVMKVGQFVMEHGGSRQQENWFMRILHSRREEKVVYLTDAVKIEVVE